MNGSDGLHRIGHAPPLVGGRTLAQVQDNAKAPALTFEAEDFQRIRSDVVALGEPQKE